MRPSVVLVALAGAAGVSARRLSCEGRDLVPIEDSECAPLTEEAILALPKCDVSGLGPGDLCEGDGECDTDKKLDNALFRRPPRALLFGDPLIFTRA